MIHAKMGDVYCYANSSLKSVETNTAQYNPVFTAFVWSGWKRGQNYGQESDVTKEEAA